MTCYNPVPAVYNIADFKATGKKKLILVIKQDTEEKRNLTKFQYPPGKYELIHVPCGKCAGCRSDNAKMWSTRAYNELKTCNEGYTAWKNKYNCTINNACFITLTYDDNSPFVQKDPLCVCDLRYKHFQDFMKRLRKKCPDSSIQYIVCGEYGSQSGRSHWHAILFNYDFEDKKLEYISKGFEHYSSELLQECWSEYDRKTETYSRIGFVDLANVDIDCCKYVAGYVLKKLPLSEKGFAVTEYYDERTGEFEEVEYIDRTPPMIRSSRRPSIGQQWYYKYGRNACEKGFQYLPSGKDKYIKVKTPRYYENKFEQDCPELYQNVKQKRTEQAKRKFLQFGIDYAELKRQGEAHLFRIKNKIKDILTSKLK